MTFQIGHTINVGRKWSDETKKKQSECKKESKNPNWKGGLPYCVDCGIKLTNYRRLLKKYLRCKKCFLIYARSKEHKEKLSKSNIKIWLGKRLSIKHRRNISLNHADMRGESSPLWRGGKSIHSKGYIILNMNKHGYIYEHRLVMEKHLGRHLRPEETVHHINGNPADNRIENLVVFRDLVAHLKFERGEKINLKNIIFDGNQYIENSDKKELKWCQICLEFTIHQYCGKEQGYICQEHQPEKEILKERRHPDEK